ncbi:MAG: metal-binding protein [Methylococcaceae bacterium]|nr:metal-binding protein [Methylococcaceae bacterium]
MTQQPCDLCGLPVETPDFSLRTISGPKRFCCEGCHGIYQMLHESEILPATAEDAEAQS